MAKLQKIKRANGSLVYSVNIPLGIIDELKWEKGDKLTLEKDNLNKDSIVINLNKRRSKIMGKDNTKQTIEKTKEQSKIYVHQTNPNSEELVKIRRAELKELRTKAVKDRRYRLARAAERRVMRDDKIDKINLKLKTIKDQMTYYNRVGKVERDEIDILGTINNLIKNDADSIN